MFDGVEVAEDADVVVEEQLECSSAAEARVYGSGSAERPTDAFARPACRRDSLLRVLRLAVQRPSFLPCAIIQSLLTVLDRTCSARLVSVICIR